MRVCLRSFILVCFDSLLAACVRLESCGVEGCVYISVCRWTLHGTKLTAPPCEHVRGNDKPEVTQKPAPEAESGPAQDNNAGEADAEATQDVTQEETTEVEPGTDV